MSKKRKTKKERLIERIRTIIEQDGSFTTGDVDASSSPIYKSFGKDSHALCERFFKNDVGIDFYVNKFVTDTEMVSYEELDTNTLEEILFLAEEWSVICYKTMKRAQD